MFDIIKQNINLVEHLEKELGVSFKQSGENWRIEGRDVESCPFCGHHDCFSVKHDGDNMKSFYKCFSCGEFGDVITWKAKREGLLKPGTQDLDLGLAARKLAEEYKIQLPNNYNPIQQVFTLAANYYQNCLLETCNKSYPLLGGMTPLEYQTTVRRRKPEILNQFKLGFSDGGLTGYLESIGMDEEVMLASGLIKRNKNEVLQDYLPRNCFIYPHFVGGRASHFTFKDPLRKLAYQLPKKFSLNGYLFYGQDSIRNSDTVVIVEGENDLLAVMETKLCPAVVATIGQLSSDQQEWLKVHCKDKKILTMFDPDDAGDKYRQRLEVLRRSFHGLAHVRPPEGKDIDELLINGADLNEICATSMVKVVLDDGKKTLAVPWDAVEPLSPSEPVQAPEAQTEATPSPEPENRSLPPSEACEVDPETGEITPVQVEVVSTPKPSIYVPPNIPGDFNKPTSALAATTTPDSGEVSLELADSNVVQRNGRYARIKWVDNEIVYTPISDFTIELLNVYQKEDGDREREVIIRKVDGTKSEPFMINSETKVSLKSFKILVARIADAEWTGRELDLDAMWRLVYDKAPAAIIKVPHRVGWHSLYRCWIFKNVLITASGVAIQPDENGVFWVQGKSLGIKPAGIDMQDDGMDSSIPSLETGKTLEESEYLLGQIVEQLGRNLNCTGSALLMLGWIWSCVYADMIFKENRGMSMLLLWSTNGGGKTTILTWLRSFFGFSENTGRTTVQRLHSGIGFQRQGGYYASLPLGLDELRKSSDLTSSVWGLMRSWYDRDGRVLATREGGSILKQQIRSTLIVAGEELPNDPATRERCVSIRIKKEKDGRETKNTFQWFQKYATEFSSITYRWILDACMEDMHELFKRMGVIDATLKASGCTSRVSKNWSAAGYFGNELAKKYCPGFDFMAFLVKATAHEQEEQIQDNTLNTFWESVEILASAPQNPRVNDTMYRIDEHKKQIYIWFPAMFTAVSEGTRKGFEWAKNSLLQAIKEEPYFIREDQKIALGLTNARRRVLTLDLTKAPISLQNLANYEPTEEKKTSE